MKPSIISVKGFLLILVLGVFSSCVSTNTYRFGRTFSFDPNIFINPSDFELLGEMDISVKYSQYLRVIKIFESINDKEVSGRNINTIEMYGKSSIPLSPTMYRALYDVYVKYPDADFTVPSFVISEQENLFLGKKIKKTARIKVYKLKF